MNHTSKRMIKAHVLQNGHIDHITGPRCIIKPDEGKHKGLYLIAHTVEVLKEGQEVVYDTILRIAVAKAEAGR
jgi:cAMP phosphodiesterase